MSEMDLSGGMDVEDFFAAQRAATRRSIVRAVKFFALTLLSLVVGAAVAYPLAKYDESFRKERLADYNAGHVVVIRRGDSVFDTSPSPTIPVAAGLGAAALVFAGGAALMFRDRTYLRGLRALVR